jgi:hypothetical protein
MNKLSYVRGGAQVSEVQSPQQVSAVSRPSYSNSALQQANMLAPHVSINDMPENSMGNVSLTPMSSGLPFFTFTLNNTATGTREFVIGDPQGIIAAVSGKTLTQPTGSSAGTVAAGQASFVTGEVVINLINYSATSGANQFGLPFNYAVADTDGSLYIKPVPVALAPRNDQFNANRLTLGGMGIVLKRNTGLLITVAASSTVVLGFQPAASAGR